MYSLWTFSIKENSLKWFEIFINQSEINKQWKNLIKFINPIKKDNIAQKRTTQLHITKQKEFQSPKLFQFNNIGFRQIIKIKSLKAPHPYPNIIKPHKNATFQIASFKPLKIQTSPNINIKANNNEWKNLANPIEVAWEF
jgi:hypothetical protein